MDGGSRVSDFSIERILSPQLGHKMPPVMDFAPGGYFQGIPGGYWTLYPGNLSPPAPVPALASVRDPVPVPGCLQYRGMRFVDAYLPYGAAGFHPTDFSNMYPNSGERMRFSSQDSADPQQLAGYHGYHQAGLSEQSQLRQKSRMRTVFTDGQAKRLEVLFALSDYPLAETRAELARSTGLSEETVRIWFKNRRARRKRQCHGSKVKSSSPSPSSAGAENKFFASFL
ncbi:homeobox protein engrailed-like ceh-16 [Sander lucioperca]|uniref:homeobox protein engrailed-like ceh-16 n=1 Tax=Sander lucioperca TaxID=283035 RepID=UPI00125DF162|nr:homeobox protein engrailed-like ceh-16 [Sander lucioperca]